MGAVEILKDPEQGSEPEQLEFFDRALLRISSKETQRSLETIVKELVRLGIPNTTISHVVRILGSVREDVKDAAVEIDRL